MAERGTVSVAVSGHSTMLHWQEGWHRNHHCYRLLHSLNTKRMSSTVDEIVICPCSCLSHRIPSQLMLCTRIKLDDLQAREDLT